jgi:MOSC domain-containing protein YiiM
MEIVHLYISPDHNYFGHHGQPAGSAPVVEVPEVSCVAGCGIQGDRFFNWKPDYKGQVTFFAMEIYRRLCQEFLITDSSPAVFRRNIVTRGVDLNRWIGQEFELQGVRFLGTEESKPCYWMNQAFAEGAEAAMKGHGGLRAKVLSTGTLRCG